MIYLPMISSTLRSLGLYKMIKEITLTVFPYLGTIILNETILTEINKNPQS
jgi:hypothetical protein